MSCHALERIRERYKQDLDFGDLRRMELEIIAGNGTGVRLVSEHSKVCLLKYNGKRHKVIYCTNTGRIITALPLKGRKTSLNHTVYRAGRKHRIV